MSSAGGGDALWKVVRVLAALFAIAIIILVVFPETRDLFPDWLVTR